KVESWQSHSHDSVGRQTVSGKESVNLLVVVCVSGIHNVFTAAGLVIELQWAGESPNLRHCSRRHLQMTPTTVGPFELRQLRMAKFARSTKTSRGGSSCMESVNELAPAKALSNHSSF